MTKIINKSEILFLYDIKDANPNGDPLDENKPRIDEETGINIVTDVRLKRTIRDYLITYRGYDGTEGKDIFVREIRDEEGNIQDGKMRAKDFNEQAQEILNRCIDVRLFGGTIPLARDSITYTGPVQFKMGRSLHPVVMKHIKGTGAFASRAGTKQATFREEDVLLYSFIAFCGIINPAAAKHTHLSEEDIDLLLEAIWEGTKNLISRSKFGQMPRLILKVNYNSPTFFIGDLDRYIKMESNLPFEKIRDVSEFNLDVTGLHQILNTNKEKIESCQYLVDERLNLVCQNEKVSLENIFDGIKFEKIAF